MFVFQTNPVGVELFLLFPYISIDAGYVSEKALLTFPRTVYKGV